jgi:hypothetical protein
LNLTLIYSLLQQPVKLNLTPYFPISSQPALNGRFIKKLLGSDREINPSFGADNSAMVGRFRKEEA